MRDALFKLLICKLKMLFYFNENDLTVTLLKREVFYDTKVYKARYGKNLVG